MPCPTSDRPALHERRYFKEIGALLLVKTCLIVAIRFAFFATPAIKPDPVGRTSAHLLGAPLAATAAAAPSSNSSSSQERSPHDQ